MGKYVNETTNGYMGASAKEKSDAIIADGGIVIPQPTEFKPNLVCVMDNGLFGAAMYVFCEREFNYVTKSSDNRPKTWIEWDKVEQFGK